MEHHAVGATDPDIDGEPLAGSLVELILAVSDETEDLWEIGDRIDRLVGSGRACLSGLV